MRTSLVIGASSLRRLASGALVAGLLATGLATLGAAPASALASTRGGDHHDGRVGGHWDGGKARTGGVEYSWGPGTLDYEGNACPELDSGKTDLTTKTATVVITADPGKLISSYCIKAGSDNSDEGPKLVKLEQPVARLTIAYPVDGRCKDISHYSVAFVDAPTDTGSTPPSTTPASPVEESTPPSDDETIVPAVDESAPADDESPGTPAVDGETPTPSGDETIVPAVDESAPAVDDETPGDDASAAVATPAPSPSTTVEPSTVAAVVSGDDATPSAAPGEARLAATDEGPAVKDAGRLAFTGAQVTGVLVAAVVLVAIGTLAIHASRRRADAGA